MSPHCPLLWSLTSWLVRQSIANSFLRRLKMAAGGLSERDVRTFSLRVIAFPGASSWPLWGGQQKGFFAAEGLELSLSITPNSVHKARELYAGGANVTVPSMDNGVANGLRD